jgi:hypothetical protein
MLCQNIKYKNQKSYSARRNLEPALPKFNANSEIFATKQEKVYVLVIILEKHPNIRLKSALRKAKIIKTEARYTNAYSFSITEGKQK